MSKHCWTLKDRYESQFSAAFYPILMSDTKRSEIIHRAEEIRAVRNDISEVFFSDMLGFQDIPAKELVQVASKEVPRKMPLRWSVQTDHRKSRKTYLE